MITDETLKHYRNKITYAQNREDLLLESFFVDKKNGFYVDVGAYDPDIDSVTKLFYSKGWRGINIEPQPDQYRRFSKKRTRDININTAIGSQKGAMALRVYKSGGLSTLSEEVKKQYLSSSNATTDEWEDIEVSVIPLKEIFQKNKVGPIDFMKVDVEGYEMSVLESNDWDMYRPRVLCIEAGFSASQSRHFLKEKNYLRVFNDGLNDYYVDKSLGQSRLSFIDHVLIRRGGGIRYEDYENARKLYLYNKSIEKKLIESLEREKQLHEENSRLRGTLDDKRALLRKSLKMYVNRFGARKGK